MRDGSGTDIVWVSPLYLTIDGTAQPDSIEYPEIGRNSAAALRILDSTSGDGLVIEGRPEQILERAREILRTAELIVEQTMRDPQLRALYGITSQVGTPDA